ncbi:unnamed protein product [Allacma fusca]|uniref:RING finger protein unkempt n=1 Tax=Allacma fusca TaxID=39272 RepID=A0A8J2KTQ5_9HEXA|nr:unnamed protein product [Allacma fusca]
MVNGTLCMVELLDRSLRRSEKYVDVACDGDSVTAPQFRPFDSGPRQLFVRLLHTERLQKRHDNCVVKNFVTFKLNFPMPSEAKSLLLQTPPEKPNHYRYLKEFRVEQCPLFPQHKCTQHRPFLCFNWHFPNQRRRRPVRKRDGTFNYSPDTYCTRYDETSGTCPDGDDCVYLHRTAGDTERRYHLRYFKTCMCVYETDNRGFCTKNGAHCAFAHGELDKRPPVFDIRELQLMQSQQENAEEPVLNGPNQLDKERSMMVDDPKWQDANYVLINYKTEPCKRPPRLCQKGYACPQYHNIRDRRRSPKKHKYRSTPCPNVKHGDEWGEPTACEDGDDCPYCHTRTEQQFHPEIYKSSKCHDVFSNQYCPRGPFCAFAHADQEMSINRNVPSDTNLADILSNALPAMSSTSSSSIPKGDSSSASSSLADFSTDTLTSSPDFHFGGASSNSIGGSNSTSSSSTLIGGSSGTSGNAGNIGPAFRPTSFAKAVSTYSNIAASGNTGSGLSASTNPGSKFFDEKKQFSAEDAQIILNGVANLSANSGIGNAGVAGGVLGPNQTSLFDTLDSLMTYNLDLGTNYSLFPSSSKGTRDELSRDDSPSTDKDKDNESDNFGGGSGDISVSTGGGSKPVSIPSAPGFPYRERFPSGSSPMTSSLNNYNPMGSNMFSKNELDAASEIANNHSLPFFEFSPRQNSTMSPRGSIANASVNGFMGSNHSSITMAPGAASAVGGGNNGSNNGNSNGPHSSLVVNVLGRSDLAYMSVQKLTQLAICYKQQLEAVTKALSSHSKDSAHYSCLNCKNKDRPRTIVLVPCDHQVLCSICAPNVLCCPLCRADIRNRKQVSLPPLKTTEP